MGSRQEVAEQLRQAREAKELTLDEVQAKTKIHIEILRSLEKGEIPSSINQVYLRGFIKIYANFLGLDAASIIEGFNVGLPPAEKPVRLNKEAPARKQINLFWQNPRFLSILKFTIPVVAALLAVFLIFSAIKKVSRSITHRRAVKVSQVTTVPAKNIPIDKSSQISFSVHAKDSAWLQVKADGKTLFQGMFRKGLAETWVAKEKMEVSLGDAGAVELAVNDKRVPALGRRGEAVKNIRITKEGMSVGEPR